MLIGPERAAEGKERFRHNSLPLGLRHLFRFPLDFHSAPQRKVGITFLLEKCSFQNRWWSLRVCSQSGTSGVSRGGMMRTSARPVSLSRQVDALRSSPYAQAKRQTRAGSTELVRLRERYP